VILECVCKGDLEKEEGGEVVVVVVVGEGLGLLGACVLLGVLVVHWLDPCCLSMWKRGRERGGNGGVRYRLGLYAVLESCSVLDF